MRIDESFGAIEFVDDEGRILWLTIGPPGGRAGFDTQCAYDNGGPTTDDDPHFAGDELIEIGRRLMQVGADMLKGGGDDG